MIKFLIKIIRAFLKRVAEAYQGGIRGVVRIFFAKRTAGVSIYEVLAITPGRNRAWVNTSVGVIKKPNGSIPAKLLETFGGYRRERYMQFILNK